MLKKIFIIIIIFLIVFLGWYFWPIQQKDSQDTNQTSTSTAIFPIINTITESIGGVVNNIISTNKTDQAEDVSSELSGLLREISRTESPNFILSEESEPTIIFIDNQTGNFYKLSLLDLKQKPVRISSMTILDIFNLDGFVKNNKLVALVDTIKNSGELKKITVSKNNIDGPTLTETGEIGDNVVSSVISPYNSYIYYTENMIDKTLLYKTKDGTKSQIGELPLSDWKIETVGKKLIASSYPDPNSLGHAYVFDLDSNVREKLIMDIKNLTLKLSPDYKKIIYSTGSTDNFLYILDRSEKINLPLTISTFPEKCVWLDDSTTIFCAVPKKPLSGYDLTAWKRGEVGFNDYFVNINAKTGNITTLDSSSIGEDVDAINLKYSKTLGAIVFTNKTNLHTYILGL